MIVDIGGEIMAGRGMVVGGWWQNYEWSWVVVQFSNARFYPIFYFVWKEKTLHFFLNDSNQLDKVVCARKNFAFKICTPNNDCSNYILQILVVRWQFQEPIYLNEDKNIVEKNSRMHPS